MILLIDAGNSRIKWLLRDATQVLQQGVADYTQWPALAATWQALAPTRAYGAAVVQATQMQQIAACVPCDLRWVETTAAACGVRNHYHQVSQMGVDRWLAVLGARTLVAGDVLVASAGTALTIESLTAEGDYLGGLILPGYRLMLQSLAHNTARLQQPAGQWAPWPQSTPDALETGALEAMVGAIERARQRLAAHTGRGLPHLLLCGGDAARLRPLLASPCEIVDNLVLTGLSEVADKT